MKLQGFKQSKDFKESFFADNFLIYNSKTRIDDLEIFLRKISNLDKINGETEISIYLVGKYVLKKLGTKKNREFSKIFGDLNVSSFYETVFDVLLEGLNFKRGSINIKKFNNFVDL
jgi:hypothetical protein